MAKAPDVSSQLWSMANELRGTMDASEYRNYILGFMFYRYLSEKQEKYLSVKRYLSRNIRWADFPCQKSEAV